MPDAPILIAGAGPTGLALALSLARRGAPPRLIAAAAGPGETSRAMGVQARTLEFYRQFGFGDDIAAAGLPASRARWRRIGADGSLEDITSFDLGEMGGGLSPYPYVLAYPQDDHERFLVRQLAAAGVEVEWRTRLESFAQDSSGVDAVIAHQDGRRETLRASYICGCDGAHSLVRRTLGVEFAGGTYPQMFFVADVKISGGLRTEIQICLGARSLNLMFPVRSSGMQRLIGLVPPELGDRAGLTFEDIRQQAERSLDIRVEEVNWFSAYHSHHRVAARFQDGRAFILGDAAHIHSPAGGQGMNTGIGDAVNLGWKLAHVALGRAGPQLLETYEPERIAFARRLVATTDSAFAPIVSGGFFGEFARRVIAPLAATAATSFSFTRETLFRTLSQIHIHYPDSPLSFGKAGGLRGGDRLPWIDLRDNDNFAPLRSLDWQVHVHGAPLAELAETCGKLELPLHAWPWGDAARRAGLAEGAAYLVRPDGYVGLAAGAAAGAAIEAYAARLGLRLGARQRAQRSSGAEPNNRKCSPSA